jgi:hypothetical protein
MLLLHELTVKGGEQKKYLTTRDSVNCHQSIFLPAYQAALCCGKFTVVIFKDHCFVYYMSKSKQQGVAH